MIIATPVIFPAFDATLTIGAELPVDGGDLNSEATPVQEGKP